jgi:hypothetical protein
VLLVIAFGIAPMLPPATSRACSASLPLPRWIASPHGRVAHAFWLISGSVVGLMAASLAGFLGAPTAGLYFKIAVDVLAAAGLAVLGWRLRTVRMFPATPGHGPCREAEVRG